MLWKIKQCFFKAVESSSPKKIFKVKRMKKVFPTTVAVDNNLFLHLPISNWKNNGMKTFFIKKKKKYQIWKPQPSEPPWSPDSYLPNKLGYFCLIKSPLKMIMRFISSQGLFSFLRYLHFCLDFFAHGWKWFDKKAKINFKIYDLTNWNTNNEHIVKIIEKEGNQMMKFGQLVEYN